MGGERGHGCVEVGVRGGEVLAVEAVVELDLSLDPGVLVEESDVYFWGGCRGWEWGGVVEHAGRGKG